MSVSLTPTQQRLAGFIRGFMERHGYSPSYSEMMDGVGVRGKSAIHRLLIALEERGVVRRRHGKARAIEMIDAPQPVSIAPDSAPLYFVAVRG